MTKEFAVGSNGYYFIDGFHVDKEQYEKEMMLENMKDMDDKINKIYDKLFNN